MQIAKWGNDLAVRLPADVIARQGLKEGDEVSLEVQNETLAQLHKRRTPGEAIAHIRTMQRPFPEGWKFDRDEANER